MSLLDIIILCVYLVAVLVIGHLCSRRSSSAEETYLASRNMGFLPIGLSVMVTSFSAINYVALPEEISKHGLYTIASFPVFFLAAWPIAKWWMPMCHRLRLTSVYEIFEHRYDVRVRRLASALFLLWRFFWMAMALYVSGKILSVFSGWPQAAMIIVCGVIATTYTTMGGMRAVMWTDVMQFCVLFAGIALGIGYALAQHGTDMFTIMYDGGRFKPFSPFDASFLSWDPRIRITLWSALLGTFTAFMTRYGADQVVMQRYFTAKNLRAAQRGIWLNAVVSTISLSLLALLGLAAYTHAVTELPNGAQIPAVKQLAMMVTSFPTGLTGLIIAGILAATMSSIDSGINACSAAFVTDFPVSEGLRRASRRLALIIGLSSTLIALLLIPAFGRHADIFPIVNKLVNGLGSPLLAMVLLAMFSKRTNAAGMLIGGSLGLAASLIISFAVKPLALHYYAVANLLVCLAACYLSSLAVAWRRSCR